MFRGLGEWSTSYEWLINRSDDSVRPRSLGGAAHHNNISSNSKTDMPKKKKGGKKKGGKKGKKKGQNDDEKLEMIKKTKDLLKLYTSTCAKEESSSGTHLVSSLKECIEEEKPLSKVIYTILIGLQCSNATSRLFLIRLHLRECQWLLALALKVSLLKRKAVQV